MKRWAWMIWVAAGAVAVLTGCQATKTPRTAKNVIIMVPDGMGLPDVTAARIFKGGPDGAPLSFETLAQVGYQRTHSANSAITDSAAAASAWATGRKHDNGQISWRGEDDRPETILEIARDQGKATGLVATSGITHATPAAFGAHVPSRKMEGDIARQYILETKVDLLMGGGFGNNPEEPKVDLAALIVTAVNELGYVAADSLDALEAAFEGKGLGLFTQGAKTQELFRVDPAQAYPEGEPTLPEMTASALRMLSKDPDGFFLLVEGSQVDWRNHANDVEGMVAEVLAFEAAVDEVIQWLNAEPSRWAETLLIVVPDHETGGFQINGPYGGTSKKGDIVKPGWTTKGHTAVDTIIWSQGVGSERLGRALDNTDVNGVMKEVLK